MSKRKRPVAGGAVPASSSTVNLTPYPVLIARATIVSGRVRDRLEVDVDHCPRCQAMHRHRAPVEWLGGLRTSPCGLRYRLVPATRQVAA